MSEIKKLGRPAGASRYNHADEQILRRVAILLVQEKVGNPTEGMRRCGAEGDAQIRRLQRKWRGAGDRYLSDARHAQSRREHAYVPATLGAAGIVDRINQACMAEGALRAALEPYSSLSKALELHQASQRIFEMSRPNALQQAIDAAHNLQRYSAQIEAAKAVLLGWHR